MRIHHLALAAIVSVSLSAQSPLTTTYAGGNGLGTNTMMWFDLTVNTAVTISQIDVNAFANSTPGSIDIYTIAGTHVGNETNSAIWTLQDTVTVTTVNPTNTPTPCVLNTPFQLTPGSYGVAIGYTGGLGQAYTTGPVGPFSNTEMTLVEGGSGGIWGGITNMPRAFNGSIHYSVGSGFATKLLYGEGCYDSPRMVYEQFPVNTTPIDLINTQWTMLFTPSQAGGNYIILPTGPVYDGATAATNGVDLVASPFTSSSSNSWDDASIVVTLPLASFPNGFPFPGSSSPTTTDITVNSNGKIYLAATTSTTFATNGSNYGSLAPFTSLEPQLAPFNTDLDPSVGGNIWYEDPSPSGGVRITWDNVPNWPAVAGIACNIQMELLPSGTVTIAYGVDLACNGTAANDAVVGFSAGNSEPASTPIDWSAITSLITGDGSVPLNLDGDARPILGTTVNMTVGNIPPGSPIAAMIYGLTQNNPGIDLTFIGMPGCSQYCSQDAVALGIAPGTSFVNAFAVPNDPGLTGVIINAQGACYSPGLVPNTLGALSSNGVELTLDIN